MTVRAWIRGLLARPALPDDEQNRQASIVHTLLLPLCAMSLLLLGVYLLTGASGRDIGAVATFSVCSVLVLHFVHAGRVTAASWLFVSVIYLGALGPEWLAPNHDPLPMSMLVVVLAGLLLGGAGALLFCELCCAQLVFVAYYHAPAFAGAGPGEVLTSVVFATVLLHSLTLALHLIHGNLHRALVRAREYARTLETRTEQLERAQGDLVAARDQALEATREKSRFLANMSHEIRTPLNAVVGMSRLLLDTSLDARQREFVDTIGHSSDLLLALVTDILDFSRVESGQLELESAPVQLRACIHRVTRLVEHQAEAKGLTLEAHVTSDVPMYIQGDPTRLGQVLLNLLSNAIKFTDEGQVELAVTARGPAEPHEPELEFAVSDTGIGVAEVRVEHLFEVFSQADVSTTRRYGGTGLGLAICRQLVELMGGRIWVETQRGEGSTFRFVIPCRPVDVREAVEPPPRPLTEERKATSIAEANGVGPASIMASSSKTEETPGKHQSLSVLVAEDNVINQRVLLALLERLGYEADVVDDGAEAVAALDHRAYDIVFMDLQMPRMDGEEATRRIRAQRGAAPYIVAVTADVTTEMRSRCEQAGMDGFVAKPLRRDELKHHLRAAYERREPAGGCE